MAQLLSYLATFGGGIVTGYVLQLLQEFRHQTKAVSREVYIPLRQRLANARPGLVNGAKFTAYHEWQKINDSGFMLRVPKKIRMQLSRLFDVTLPNYDKTWFEFDAFATTLAQQWDQMFGVAMPGESHFRVVSWWLFLAADHFEWNEAEPLPGDAISLRERVLTNGRLLELNLSLKQFAFERWQESCEHSTVLAFRDSKKQAFAEIDAALELLQKNIRL